MGNPFNRLPKFVTYILNTFFTGLIFFSIFRLILFFNELNPAINFQSKDITSIWLKAFIIGIRFDTVISLYILAIPILIFSLQFLFNLKIKLINRILFYFVFLLYTVAFFICAADIPFFHQFFSRFNATALQWTESSSFMIKMVFQEFSYWWILIPFSILIFSFYKLHKRFFLAFEKSSETKSGINFLLISGKLLFILLLFLFTFVGIRGRIEHKSPIRVGTAYFSSNPFANQLGLNPVFTFIRSYLDFKKSENQPLNLINTEVAIRNVRKFLHRPKTNLSSPIAKLIRPKTNSTHKRNVILVIMESMSAAKMQRYGNKNNLTPFLDSLAENGFVFDNFYSAGIHTFNGLYSTTIGYPAIFNKHPMKGAVITMYNGLGTTLKKMGYSTNYFTTHDEQFDNVGGFFRANGFENIISKKDYPQDKVLSTLGVPDDYLFEFSIQKLNEINKSGKPFLAVYMTASDHGPYIIPSYFKPKQKEIKKQIVEYADWSIKKFIRLASKYDWFKNTIFLFVADHGAALNVVYEMPLNYNHVPFIIYAPKILNKTSSFKCPAGQIDIFPTIMGLLNLPYLNNSLGIDLLKDKRKYILFGADNNYGVIDEKFFMLYRNKKDLFLFKYKKRDLTNYISEFPSKADSMLIFLKSNLQTADWLIRNNKTFLK